MIRQCSPCHAFSSGYIEREKDKQVVTNLPFSSLSVSFAFTKYIYLFIYVLN